MLMPYLPLFVGVLMVNSELTGIYTGIAIGSASLAGTLSGVVLGRLGDKVGHKRVLVTSAIVTAVFYFPMAFVTNIWQLIALNVVVGFAVGGVLPAISAMLARFTDPKLAGSVYGLDNSVGAAARAVSPAVAGLIITATSLPGTENYRAIFIATALLFGVTAALAAARLPGDSLPLPLEPLPVAPPKADSGDGSTER